MRADPKRIFAKPSSTRRPAVTRVEARASAEHLPRLHDQQPDIGDAAYRLIVGEGGPLLLALASADPTVSGLAMSKLRDLSRRYADFINAERRRAGL